MYGIYVYMLIPAVRHFLQCTSLYQLYALIFVYKFYKLYAPLLSVLAYTSRTPPLQCTSLYQLYATLKVY